MPTQNSFTTTAGRVVKCRPVSETLVIQALNKIEADYRARGEPLDPPTYTIQLVGGEEKMPHDETTLEVEGNPELTAQNKEAWAKYQAAVAKLENAKKIKRQDLWLLGGLDFEIKEDGWDKRQEEIFGIVPPTDPVARRRHYIDTELLQTVDDLMNALETISLLSMSGAVDQEAVKARIATFRNSLQGLAAGAVPQA